MLYRPRVQTSSEGPASVNAMKQACAIVILAFFLPHSNPIRTENAA